MLALCSSSWHFVIALVQNSTAKPVAYSSHFVHLVGRNSCSISQSRPNSGSNLVETHSANALTGAERVEPRRNRIHRSSAGLNSYSVQAVAAVDLIFQLLRRSDTKLNYRMPLQNSIFFWAALLPYSHPCFLRNKKLNIFFCEK